MIASCVAAAQYSTNTPTPATVGGLTTNTLAAPSLASVSLHSSGCGTGVTYTYEVAAVDFNNGLTPYGTTSSGIVCSTLPGTVGGTFIYFTLPTVTGAANCYVSRIVSSSATYVGTYPCGSTVYDFGINGTPTNTPSATNTTGGIAAAGFVSGQAFFANGSGAGTDILSAGVPLPTCGAAAPFAPLPCISNAGEVFLQAPNATISASWGITLPNAAPAANGALLLSVGSGTPVVSGASFATLSNSGGTELMTASGSFSTGDILVADGSGDSTDSTVAIFNAGSGAGANYAVLPVVSYPQSAGTNQVVESAANKVRVIQFILPYKLVVGHVSAGVTTTSTGSFNIGIYSSNGNTKWVDSGSLSCATAAVVGASITQVTLQPGVYYEAVAATDTTCGLSGMAGATGIANLFNLNATRVGTATNTLSGGLLPGTLSTITGGSTPLIFALVEP